MFRTSIRGPRAAALLIGCLIAVGVFAAGPAAGADQAEVVRVIVQLDDPALAKYRDTFPGLKGVVNARTAKGNLDVKAPASRAYLAHLAGKHKEFKDKLRDAVPSAAVQWEYDTALNGVAIEVSRDRIDAIRKLPHVVSVTETYEVEPELDESKNLLNLQTLWQSLPSNPLGAGAGLRLALIDSGVNALHPFFNPSGFTAPAGYPKSERVSGGVRTPMPLATYTNNKVIVANVYPYPGNTTATPWGPASLHATHVAGIMAGVEGTYNYTSGPATFALKFSGMAPGAYIMSYRLDGDSAEFLAAIEDVVADDADALNISLGHSRWLTTDPSTDPIREALDAAVDAGVVVAASSGNAGTNGDTSVTGSWKLSPKVITVANSSHARVFSNAVTVTGTGVPASLIKRPGVPGGAPTPPIASTISAEYVVAPGGVDGNAGLACDPLLPGSLAGKILLAARGVCGFDIKKQNALAAGAVAYIVHNNGPDAPISMGGITAPAIPGVMVTQADGRAIVAWAAGHPGATLDIEGPLTRLTTGWPDVVAASSSKGPALTMAIKPDIAAPGSSVLSSVVNDATGAVNPAGLFDQLSGTSMSTPHITALAGLTKAKHPTWSPAQIKSALMNTASTSMSLDLEGNIPALAKHRGAGRVNAARLVNPLLTFDPPSLSFGLMRPGQAKRMTITATDMRESGGPAGYSLNVRQIVGNAAVGITPTPTFTTTAAGSASFDVNLSVASAPPGDYEGFLEVTGGGQTYTIPYFVRVQDPTVAKDVLLIDWDRNLGGVDFRPTYTAALDALGVSYDVFDGGTANVATNAAPTYAQLQNYRSIVFFTGNNTLSWALTHVGGSFPLQDYLVAGGKIVMTGQDFNSFVTQAAATQNSGSDWNLATMAGWQDGAEQTAPPACAFTRSDRDFYGTGAANPATAQLETAFTLFGRTGDVSTNLGGTGANNQRFPDSGRPLRDSDWLDRCVEAYPTPQVLPHLRALGRYTTTKKDGTVVSRVTENVATGVAPDPTLAQLDPRVKWGAALVHVGLEGLNANRGELSPQSALRLMYDFVADSVSVSVTHKVTADRVAFVASAASARGAAITKYRWDFGDGSPIVETTAPTVTHEYGKGSRGTYTAYVEATNALTRTGVGSATVTIKRR